MIVGYHIIFGAYGFWLPNDPRGSWSDFVGSYELYRAGGKATLTSETRSLASRPHDRDLRVATKQALSRPAVRLSPVQVESVARGFGEYAAKSGLPVWACSIMPDHAHVVIGRFRLKAEAVATQLKATATARLVAEGIHPFQALKPAVGPPPKCWAQGEWKVYLDPDDVWRAIRYVENNLVKDGLPRQRCRARSLPRSAAPHG